MENSVNLEALIEDSGLSRQEIACRLFPNNKYPEAALTRVLKGESFLDSLQIIKLSEMLDMSVSEIFHRTWEGKMENGLHILTRGDYKAILHVDKKQTRLFHKDTLMFETILHSTSIPLSEYLALLNEQIEKYISN